MGTRTYWACPDEAAIARCFTEIADPVAAMNAARKAATKSFFGDALTGEPVRNPRDWSDQRVWYPMRVEDDGPDEPCPVPAHPLCSDYGELLGQRDVSEVYEQGLRALAVGNFADGWPLYEYRWQMPQGLAARRPFTMPLWDGRMTTTPDAGPMPPVVERSTVGATSRETWPAPLCARPVRLLAHTAQGYGDAIMFARYLPWLNDVDCDLLSFDTLTPLLQTLNFKGRVMSHQDIRTEYDFHVPLCSLPLILDPEMKELPRAPYLRSDREKYFKWRNRIGHGFNVGICWAGSSVHLKNAERCMTLETVLRACPSGAKLFSLQKGEATKQLEYLPEGVEVTDWTGEMYNWSDTAAMVDCLDLIVTVDTAVAHLAGALNRPAKLLVGDKPEWRWAMDAERGRSRWYSSVSIERAI